MCSITKMKDNVIPGDSPMGLGSPSAEQSRCRRSPSSSSINLGRLTVKNGALPYPMVYCGRV